MDLQPDDLLPEEQFVLSRNANAVIKINEYGLSRFAYDQVLRHTSMKGKEAIGGKLYVTNYRLIFKSHAFNRVTGKFSIFLPTIQEIKDASVFLSKKIEVVTKTQRFEFVIWGIPELIAVVNSQSEAITAQQKEALRAKVVSNPEAVGEGLNISQTLEGINQALLPAQELEKMAQALPDPIQQSSLLNLRELFSDD